MEGLFGRRRQSLNSYLRPCMPFPQPNLLPVAHPAVASRAAALDFARAERNPLLRRKTTPRSLHGKRYSESQKD